MLDQRRQQLAAQTDRFVVHTCVGWLAVLVGGAGLVGLLMATRATSELPRAVDQQVTDGLTALVPADGILGTFFSGLTDFGGHTLLVRVLLLATAYLLIRREMRLAAYVVVATVGALVLDPTIALLVERLPPLLGISTPDTAGPRFSGGHALGSIVGYGVLLLVFLPTVPRRRRVLVVAAAAAFVAAVALTRIPLGPHSLTDVLAGWMLGTAWLAVTVTAFRHWRHSTGKATSFLLDGLAPEKRDDVMAASAEGTALNHPWRTIAGLAVVWALILGALHGAGLLVTVVWADTALIAADQAVVQWFVDHRSPALAGVAAVGSRLGNTHWILLGTVTAAVLLLAIHRRWRPVVFLTAVMLGEVTLFMVSSTIVDRDRPDVPHLGPEIPPTSSFPSGHVAATLCLYIAVAALVRHLITNTWLRWAATAMAVLAPLYVALARIYWGVHHPLDIAGSLLLAIPWAVACWRTIAPVPGYHHVQSPPTPAGRRPGSPQPRVTTGRSAPADPDRPNPRRPHRRQLIETARSGPGRAFVSGEDGEMGP